MAGTFSPGLGARRLLKEEIDLALPTYQKLLEQIETIRKNASIRQADSAESGSRNAFLRPQVTNNLSILGPRGSGKSSILKTIYERLREGGEQNILLPPIVPENLERHMTLMSSLLGLLNVQVARLAEKRRPNCPVCPPEKDKLEQSYRELVECYVHLQKPYQDISIQKYSTESDYVRTMREVFEAGDQFSWKLWDFIDLLLSRYKEGALLFVFIDDIDLSTYRCSDVVRTLLGYISHPRVVTILAGDIEVFGEALTLDFLRQEELLGKDGIKEIYTVSRESAQKSQDLLSRKKELAYEYLKKVMPPTNRHSISVWTLSNRGGFCPVGLYKAEGGEGASSKDKEKENGASASENNSKDTLSLRALLAKTNELAPPSGQRSLLKGYFSPPGEQPEGADRVLYHLFDSTSRGLVNAYIAVKQLLDRWDDEDKRFESVKFTLETIISSNSTLNPMRELIFSRFLQFGTDSNTTAILFSNFNDWVTQKLPYLVEYGKESDKQVEEKLALSQEALTFQIFVYLDWAARLLGKGNVLDGKDYVAAKETALFLLCANGDISERTEVLSTADRTQLCKLRMSKSEHKTNLDYAAAISLYCFFGLPFPLAVRYFCSFDISKVLEIRNKQYKETAMDKLKLTVAFANAFQRFYGNDMSGASVCLAEQPEMQGLIENQLRAEQGAMLVSTICSTYFKNWDNNATLSPLYQWYCEDGVRVIQEDKCVHLPDSVATAIKEKQVIQQAALDSYLKPEAHSMLRYVSISPQGAVKTGSMIYNQGAHAEFCCTYYWNCLLMEGRDSSGAIPLYNFYSSCVWKQSADSNYRLKPLADVYKDLSQQVKLLCGENEKPEIHQDMEKRVKIIFAVDSGGLWTKDVQDEENESPTRQIKAYILKQLKANEQRFVTALGLRPQKPITESGAQCPRLIVAEGAPSAFNKLGKAYTGASNTLATRCFRFLKPLFGQDSHDHMTVAEYIYARCILQRLLHSTAWYGITEARELLSALDRASLDLPVDHCPDDLNRYIFWFHCYCRYRIVELSDETYSLVEQAYSGMKFIQKAAEKLDQQVKEVYQENMRQKGNLEDELIQQIPDLFK